MSKKLTATQQELRLRFRRGMRVVLLGGSGGTVRGHKGNYVHVLCDGPAVFGLVLALGSELTL